MFRLAPFSKTIEFKLAVEYRGDKNIKDFPTITGGAEVNTLTYGSGNINTKIGGESHKPDKNDYHDEHDTLTGSKKADPYCGTQENISGGSPNINGWDDSFNLDNPYRVEFTTCRGNSWQIFNKPSEAEGGGVLSTILGFIGAATCEINKILQRIILGITEQNKILNTFNELIPFINYGVQYNSVGKYNAYSVATNVREIAKHAYLTPNIQTVDENNGNDVNTIKINNWKREESVYIKTKLPLPPPSHIDDSKVSMKTIFGTGHKGYNSVDRNFYRNISSYYAGIKQNILNQYGAICNMDYVETNACDFRLNIDYEIPNQKVFGGDIFINRFALKRKFPFFLRNNCNLPNGSPIMYEEINNVGLVRYFYNTSSALLDALEPLDTGSDILNAILFPVTVPARMALSIFDNKIISLINRTKHSYDVKRFNMFYQDGYIYLYYYAIPYFSVYRDWETDRKSVV